MTKQKHNCGENKVKKQERLIIIIGEPFAFEIVSGFTHLSWQAICLQDSAACALGTGLIVNTEASLMEDPLRMLIPASSVAMKPSLIK